jgi:hypothetical protein
MNQGHIYSHGFMQSEMLACKNRILKHIHEDTRLASGDRAFFLRVVFDVEECSFQTVAPLA